MRGSTMPLRKPSRPAIRSQSLSRKRPSLTTHRKEAPPVSRSQSRDESGEAQQKTAKNLLEQVKEALQDVAQTASGTVREAYTKGQHYAQQARERYPQAEQYYREGRRAINQRTAENPLLSLLLAAVAGYASAWTIHGQRHGRDEPVPEYGRTNRGYAPHRDEHRSDNNQMVSPPPERLTISAPQCRYPRRLWMIDAMVIC